MEERERPTRRQIMEERERRTRKQIRRKLEKRTYYGEIKEELILVKKKEKKIHRSDRLNWDGGGLGGGGGGGGCGGSGSGSDLKDTRI